MIYRIITAVLVMQNLEGLSALSLDPALTSTVGPIRHDHDICIAGDVMVHCHSWPWQPSDSARSCIVRQPVSFMLHHRGCACPTVHNHKSETVVECFATRRGWHRSSAKTFPVLRRLIQIHENAEQTMQNKCKIECLQSWECTSTCRRDWGNEQF